MSAQNSSIILGVNGGTNFSKMSFTGDFSTQDEKPSRRIGFQGGIDLGVKFGNFSFLTGFKYVQRGGKTELRKGDPNDPFVMPDGSLDVGVQNTKTRFTNISIPLLLRYQTAGDLSFSISLGPVINKGIGSIKTEETLNLTVNGEIGPNEYENTYGDLGDDLFRGGTVGFMFSPGIIYKLNDNGHFRFNMTYNSVGDVKNDNFLTADNFGNVGKASGSIKSNALIFEVGYEHRIDFNIGSKY